MAITLAARRDQDSLPYEPPEGFRFLSLRWRRSQAEITYKDVEKAMKTKLRQDIELKGDNIKKVYEYEVVREEDGEMWWFKFAVELNELIYDNIVEQIKEDKSTNLYVVEDGDEFKPRPRPPQPTPPPVSEAATPEPTAAPPAKKPKATKAAKVRASSPAADPSTPPRSSSPSGTPVDIDWNIYPTTPPPMPLFAFLQGSPPEKMLHYSNSPTFSSEPSGSSMSPPSPRTPLPADLKAASLGKLATVSKAVADPPQVPIVAMQPPTPVKQIKVKLRASHSHPLPHVTVAESLSAADPATVHIPSESHSVPIIYLQPPEPAPVKPKKAKGTKRKHSDTGEEGAPARKKKAKPVVPLDGYASPADMDILMSAAEEVTA